MGVLGGMTAIWKCSRAPKAHGKMWFSLGGKKDAKTLFFHSANGQALNFRGLRMGVYGVSKNSGTPKWMVYNGKPY